MKKSTQIINVDMKKSTQIINAGECVEKREPSYTVGVCLLSCFGHVWLCDPMDKGAWQDTGFLDNPTDKGAWWAIVHGDSSGQNTGVGSLSLVQGIFPRIKLRSPTLQVDSLPAEPPGKPKNTGVGSLSLLQGIFPTQNWTGVSIIACGFFTCWVSRKVLKW